MKIGYKQIIFLITTAMVVLFANFYALLPASVHTEYFLILILLSVMSFSNLQDGVIRVSKKYLLGQVKWLLLILMAVVGNQSLAKGDYISTLRLIALVIYCMTLSQVPEAFARMVPGMVIGVGFVNVLATYFFLLFPQLYGKMIQIYGYVPTGTGRNGEYGYRAGIADHYSQNGIYIAMVTLVLTAYFLQRKDLSRRKRFLVWIGLMLSWGALILTSKRGPILFAFVSMIALYYILHVDKVFTSTFQLAAAGCVLLIAVYFAAPMFPGLNDLLERFKVIGSDSETVTRFRMWMLAWDGFVRHPLFGIGWFGFRYQHAAYIFNPSVNEARYMYLHAHNVYIQMLCERGLTGFVLYLYLLVSNILPPIKILAAKEKRMLEEKSVTALAAAVIIQIFYLAYSNTGNCLYDMMFCFYALAVGTASAICARFRTGKR